MGRTPTLGSIGTNSVGIEFISLVVSATTIMMMSEKELNLVSKPNKSSNPIRLH